MLPDPEETIVALSSAAGPGLRAIVRLSGRRALEVVSQVFHGALPAESDHHRFCSGEVRLSGLASGLPADLYIWHEPHSFTGQTVVEVHTISSPPLVDLLIAECLNAGARAALPGEFTIKRGFSSPVRFSILRVPRPSLALSI